MHVRREARLVDDHRYGVELSLAPTPVKWLFGSEGGFQPGAKEELTRS